MLLIIDKFIMHYAIHLDISFTIIWILVSLSFEY